MSVSATCSMAITCLLPSSADARGLSRLHKPVHSPTAGLRTQRPPLDTTWVERKLVRCPVRDNLRPFVRAPRHGLVTAFRLVAVACRQCCQNNTGNMPVPPARPSLRLRRLPRAPAPSATGSLTRDVALVNPCVSHHREAARQLSPLPGGEGRGVRES